MQGGARLRGDAEGGEVSEYLMANGSSFVLEPLVPKHERLISNDWGGQRWYFINPKYLRNLGRTVSGPRNRKLGLRKRHGGRWSRRRNGMRGLPVRRYSMTVEREANLIVRTPMRHADLYPVNAGSALL